MCNRNNINAIFTYFCGLRLVLMFNCVFVYLIVSFASEIVPLLIHLLCSNNILCLFRVRYLLCWIIFASVAAVDVVFLLVCINISIVLDLSYVLSHLYIYIDCIVYCLLSIYKCMASIFLLMLRVWCFSFFGLFVFECDP